MPILTYARVSTAEQNTDAQLDRLRELDYDREFVDHGVSGRLASRPALDEMLSYARAGDVVVVTKLDRLGRSVKNLCQIVDEFEARQIGLRVLDQGIDTTTPAGRLFFHLVAAIGEWETMVNSQRTLEGLSSARARGRVGGRRPKLSSIQVDQVRRMYETGDYTVEQIATTFGCSRPTIYRALQTEVTANS